MFGLQQRRRLKWVAMLAAMFLNWLLIENAAAQTELERGNITVLSAELLPTETGWDLLASADITLSPEIRQGLDSGVPLQFIVDFRLKKQRKWLPDKTLLAVQHRYSLIYYELTRHYRLQSMTTSESRNFRSLLGALDALGQFQSLPIPSPASSGDSDVSTAPSTALSNSSSDATHTSTNEVKHETGHLSIRLDDKALPLPLQPLFSSSWKLASEEFTWSIN